MKWFGVAALVGLAALWLFEKSAHAGGPKALTASFYGERERGRKMANGEPFDPTKFTCASWDYPLGTMLRVSANGKTVAVVVTDRGPNRRLLKTRQIDLSRAAFEALAPLKLGLIQVTVEKL